MAGNHFRIGKILIIQISDPFGENDFGTGKTAESVHDFFAVFAGYDDFHTHILFPLFPMTDCNPKAACTA